MLPLVRYKGVWHAVAPRPHESPRQTFGIAWKQIQGSTQPEREWYVQQRTISKVLYLNKKQDGQ
jgi:hypothetical protein